MQVKIPNNNLIPITASQVEITLVLIDGMQEYYIERFPNSPTTIIYQLMMAGF